MQLIVLPASDGDCLLLNPTQGNSVLVDGGEASSFRNEVAPQLRDLMKGEELQLVCVTHIDDDHVAGIAEMFEMLVEQRRGEGAAGAPQIPPVGALWHNNVRDQLGNDIGSEVAALLSVLEQDQSEEGRRGLLHETAAVLGPPKADLVSHLAAQLAVEINPGFENGLVTVDNAPRTLTLGSVEMHLIAPLQRQLDALKDFWREWLRKNPHYRPPVEDHAPLRAWAQGLVERGPDLGDIREVTRQNLASIMFLAREGGEKILFTGDGHHKDIIEGLKHVGAIDGHLHVDILKVPHHGAAANMDLDFCRTVTAHHYVFCANGSHENPDLAILDAIVEARVEHAAGPAERFTFWFSNSASTASTDLQKLHMQRVERRVKKLVPVSGGRLEFCFRRAGERNLVIGCGG